MSEDPYQMLRQTLSALRPLGEEEWEELKARCSRVHYSKKERLLAVGEVSDSYVFIAQGLARLYGYKDGEEKTLFFFKEGMFAGSVQSYLFDRPSELVLEAIEDVEGLEISKDNLQYICETFPAIANTLLTYTQLRLNGLLQFFSSFVLDSPEERYEKFLVTQPDLLNRVPQHVIASFLGVTPVSLSRIRKRISERH